MPSPTASVSGRTRHAGGLLRWDLFCRVVDNYGDLGVCRRLALHLASLGQAVRLWVDDAALVARMAPGLPQAEWGSWPAREDCAAGVVWRHWADATSCGNVYEAEPGDVIVEAFGCDPPASFVAGMAGMAARGADAPVWINLEYLSAEDYVLRSHGLPSPQMSGPGQGLRKWFFYPGFGEGTGGLLREADLLQRRSQFDGKAWLHKLGVQRRDARLLSIFAYPQAPLEALLQSLASSGEPTDILLTHGPLQARAQAWMRERPAAAAALTLTELPWLSSEDFDHLLWSCDLNFVRGEDSLTRALWAGVPFIWQLYPQDDGVHAHKLQAFWRAMQGWVQPSDVPLAAIEPWWRAWNGLADWPLQTEWPWAALPAWSEGTRRAAAHLAQRPPLANSLLAFVAAHRGSG